jgi:hypothetical protein
MLGNGEKNMQVAQPDAAPDLVLVIEFLSHEIKLPKARAVSIKRICGRRPIADNREPGRARRSERRRRRLELSPVEYRHALGASGGGPSLRRDADRRGGAACKRRRAPFR